MSLMIWNNVTIMWSIQQQPPLLSPYGGEFWSLKDRALLTPSKPTCITDPVEAIYFAQRKMIGSAVAPGFCFLMGEGLQLFIDAGIKRGWSAWKLLRYLWVRGLLLAVPLNLISDSTGISTAIWNRSPYAWKGGILFGNGMAMLLVSLVLVPLRSMEWARQRNLDAVTCLVLSISLSVVVQELTTIAVNTNHQPSFFESLLYLPWHATRWSLIDSVLPCLSLVFFGAAFGRVHISWSSQADGQQQQQRWRRRIAAPSVLFLLLFIAFLWVRFNDGWGNTSSVTEMIGEGIPSWQAFLTMRKYPYSMALSLYAMAFNQLLVLLCVSLDLLLPAGISKTSALLRPALDLADATLMGFLLQQWLLIVLVVAWWLQSAVFALAGCEATPPWVSLLVLHLVLCPLVLRATHLRCARWGTWKRSKGADSLWRML